MIPQPITNRGERVIEVRDARFVYEGGIEALRGVNLAIRSGEYVAIVGGNGSGKSTLAKLMNGLLRPTSGSVSVLGRSASEMTVAQLSRTVGFAFQNPDHQLFCSSVEEELSFGPTNLGYPAADVAKRVEYALGTMGLSDLRKEAPLSLNLGQRRRVSIASVIAMDPRVLILDEPTTGLDATSARDLLATMRRLNNEGRTIILITHEMKVVAEHANRVIVLAGGRVALDSDAHGAFMNPEILQAGRLLPPPVSRLAHKLSERGVSKEVLCPEELVFELMKLKGDDR